jgi:hypothetical protein
VRAECFGSLEEGLTGDEGLAGAMSRLFSCRVRGACGI